MHTVRQWLEQLGLPQYAEVSERNAVDPGLLCELADEDLEKLGVHALGHRKKLLKAIAALRSAGTIASPRSPDSYTPKHLAEKILTSKSALEGERKQSRCCSPTSRARWSCSPIAIRRQRARSSIQCSNA